MASKAQSESGVKSTAANLRFLVTRLPKQHQENFNSCFTEGDLLHAVKKTNAFKNRSTHTRRLNGFIDKLRPFFGALDVLSQTDPIHFATIWGATRVILQLAENYSAFFDKFTQSLADLSREMDFFSSFEEVITSVDPSEKQRMASILETAFEDLLLYLTGVMRIFFKDDGTAKSKARVFSKAVWNPFRFEYIVERMRGHRSALRDKNMMYDLRASRKAQEHRTETERQELIRTLQAWLAPPSFTDRYDQARNLRLPETSEWIFDHEIYRSWLDQSLHPEFVEVELASSIWIYGKPGCGKTVLAAAVIERLKADYPDEVCYFFFNSLRHQENDSNAALRSMLAQILLKQQKDERLLELFSFAFHFGSDGQRTASHQEIDELFDLCSQLPSIQRLFIVLDGLDECEPDDLQTKIIPKLRKLSSLKHINLVLFGRETLKADLELEELQMLRHLHIGALNFHDIRLLLHEGLVSLRQKRRLPRDLDFEESASRLARRADGMFLWARLMLSYLESRALTVSDRVLAISEVDSPEGLEKMYERIISIITRSGMPVVRLASRVFLWLIHGNQVLTAKELEEAVALDRSDASDNESPKMEAFSDTIIWSCGGFIEQTSYESQPQAPDDIRYRFIHGSVKEYFNKFSTQSALQNNAFQEVKLILHTVPANICLATQCLEYVTYQVPAQPLSAAFGSKSCGPNLRMAFPLSNYAALHWPDHLLRTEECLPVGEDPNLNKEEYSHLISALKSFLSQPNVLTAWIETSYIFDKPPPFQKLLDWASKFSNEKSLWLELEPDAISVSKRVESFASQLESIIFAWNSHLSEDPGCAWQEVSAYSNSDFFSKNQSSKMNQISLDIPVGTKLASKHVSKMSQLVSGGVHDMVLSIYPTRAFIDCYSEPRLQSLLFRTLEYSTGWVARLEIFEVHKGVKVAMKDIPLEPSEVLLHLYQTLLGGSVQFPLAISPNGRHFAVLRTLYSFVGNHNLQGSLHYVSGIIPLPENDTNRGFWSLPKKDATGYVIEDHIRMRRRDMEKLFYYWIFFDPQGQDLCVTEHTRGLPHYFAIFQLAPHPYLMLSSGVSTVSQLSKDFEFEFHPFHPAAAIAGERGIYIWNYVGGINNKLIHIGGGKALRYSETASAKGTEPLSYDIFAFSADGKFLITKTPTDPPDVHDITNYLLQRNVDSQDSYGGSEKSVEPEEDSLSPLLPQSSAQTTLGPKRILSSNGLLTIEGHTSGVLTSRSGKAVTITPLPTASSSQEGGSAFTLSRLPNRSGSSEINASIIGPIEKGETIKLVLDETASTRNDLNAFGDMGQGRVGDLLLPIVIEPSAESLAQINELSIDARSQVARLRDSDVFSEER